MLYFIMQASENIFDGTSKAHHFDLNDQRFLILMESGALPPNLFNHEAHLRVAWLHIKKNGAQKAIQTICEQIKEYDKIHGDGTKFHYTLTVASVKIVNHFMTKSKAYNFKDFLLEFPLLKTNFNHLLRQHYTHERLFAEKAKKQFVAPDLSPIA